MNVKKQARRVRALARFKIKPIEPGQDQKEYDAYVQRKEQEFASLNGGARIDIR